MTALDARDERALLGLFAPDATWTADGGGKAGAALNPILGRDRIVRLLVGLRGKFWAAGRTMEVATVNGEPGLCFWEGTRLVGTLSVTTDGERILAAFAVVNPDKLAAGMSQDAAPDVLPVNREETPS
jgi:RNA polymerase sigma-70 factor (ECF subfamily)